MHEDHHRRRGGEGAGASSLCRWRFVRLTAALSLFGVTSCPREASASAARVHDGFYARFAAGPAWLDFERHTDQSGAPGTLSYTGGSSSVSGVSLATDVSIGGTPFPRVVFSGLLHTELLAAPRLQTADGAASTLAGPLLFSLLAPTVDLFSDATSGLHYGLGVGGAAITAAIHDPPFRTLSGLGPGFTLHVGYDWWTSDEWSAGLLVRGIYASVSREQHEGSITGHERDSVATVTALVTVLYH